MANILQTIQNDVVMGVKRFADGLVSQIADSSVGQNYINQVKEGQIKKYLPWIIVLIVGIFIFGYSFRRK